MGDRGKGKEMKGFFAAKQALFPKAAGLVSEAKLVLSGVSYKSFTWLYQERKRQYRLPMWGNSMSLGSIRFLLSLPLFSG